MRLERLRRLRSETPISSLLNKGGKRGGDRYTGTDFALTANRQMRVGRTWTAVAVVLVGSALGGCTAISIAPSCPEELAVGESGPIEAHQQDEGGIPTYLWEVFPTSAGTVADPQAPTTTFSAAEEGTATLRLTASDGLYQMIAECTTNVVAADDTANGDDNDNDNANDNDNDNGNDQPPVRR